MAIVFKGFRFPYLHNQADRFYDPIKVEQHLNPVFTEDDSNIKLEILSPSMALMWTEKTSFNTIKTSGFNIKGKQNHWWYVTDLEKGYLNNLKLIYIYTLKLCPLLTHDLLKNIEVKKKISTSRSIPQLFKINENTNKIELKPERHPYVWGNVDFPGIIPVDKSYTDFSFNKMFFTTDKKWLDGSPIVNVSEEYKDLTLDFGPVMANKWSYTRGTYWDDAKFDYQKQGRLAELRPIILKVRAAEVIPVLHGLIKTTSSTNKYNTNIGAVATISTTSNPDGYRLYPVCYNRKPSTYAQWVNVDNINWKQTQASTTQGRPVMPTSLAPLADVVYKSFKYRLDKIIGRNDTFDDGYGNKIASNKPEVVLAVNILFTLLARNNFDEIRKDRKVLNIMYKTTWLPPFPDDKIVNNNINIGDWLNTGRYWDYYQSADYGVNFPSDGFKITQKPDAFKNVFSYSPDTNILDNKQTYNLKKKIKLDINNGLFTDWEKYKYLYPHLFSDSYNPMFFNVIGTEMQLFKEKLLKNGKVDVYNLQGPISEMFTIYQGDNDTAGNPLEPEYIRTHLLEEPVLYSKDTADITFQTRKNYYDARFRQVELAHSANLQAISGSYSSRRENLKDIADANYISVKDAYDITIKNINANAKKLKISQSHSLYGAQALSNTFYGTAQAGGVRGWARFITGLAAPLTGGVGTGKVETFQKALVDIANSKNIAQSTLNAQQRKIVLDRQANIDAARREEQIALRKIQDDADIQRAVIEGEIADIKTLPPTIVNIGQITKVNNIAKPIVSLGEMNILDPQAKRMWSYWNKYGTRQFGRFAIKKHLIKKKENNVWVLWGYEPWFKQNILFDYIAGGDWQPYFNAANIYDLDLIDDFNQLVKNGLRLWHLDFQFPGQNEITDIDFAETFPNWPRNLVATILNNYQPHELI